MARLFDYLLAVIAATMLAVVGHWVHTQSPGFVATLERELKENADAALHKAGMGWAEVTMRGQRAIISGQAPAPDAIDQAARVVLNSSGPGGLIFGGVTQIESQVDDSPPVSPYLWRAVKTIDGKLILVGHVPSREIRDALIAAAKTRGAVEDQMQLATGAPLRWPVMANVAIEHVSELDTGEARLSDTVLTLRGISLKDEVRARLSARISNLADPYRGEPAIRGASRWTATHGDGELVLSGLVKSQAERNEILAIARAHYNRKITDQMRIAEGAEENWMDGVRAGLPHFTKFRGGQMDYDPKGAGFIFDGEASGSTLAYLREDMAALGPDFRAAIAVDTVQVDVAEIAGIDFTGDPRLACEAAFVKVLETNKIVFAPASASITRESGETLDKIMAVSAQCDTGLKFELGGHTDGQGERSGNVELSRARAQAVAAYMTAAGFDRARLAAIGYGPDVPVASNETAQGRAQNRRLEFKVIERSAQ